MILVPRAVTHRMSIKSHLEQEREEASVEEEGEGEREGREGERGRGGKEGR